MSITATIAGVEYDIVTNSIQPENRIDDRDTLTISVLDVAGTTLFQKYQPVVLTDSILGTIFTGIINTPTMQQILWPANQKIWQLQCVDQAYRLDKELSNWTYKNQYAGTILAHQLQTYSAADHVSAEFALRWEELMSAWQQGTLSGVSATTNTSTGNVGAGDLELALAGSTVTVGCSATADWTTNGTPGSCSAISNQLIPSTYQSIMFSAVNSGNPLGGSTYDYYEIWSGSYTVASGDTLELIQWINASSPQCMVSVDAQCSDGTWISAFNSNAITDQQNLLKLAATTDLKGYADNQWYLRTFDLSSLAGKTINSFYLVFAGSSQGTYTAYFRDISINNPAGIPGSKLWIYQDGSGLNTSNQAQIIGYNNSVVSIVTAYVATATWLSNGNGDISAAAIYRTSQASIVASVPTGASLLVETSADNGNTWSAATDKTPLSGFLAGQSIAKLYYRLTMSVTGNDPTVQAIVDSVAFTIYPSYKATKTDVSNTVSGSGFSSGTLTNTSVQTLPGTTRIIGHSRLFGTNALMLNGSWRVWQGTTISNQTLYGTASPAQAVAYNNLQLTIGNGGNVRSRQDYAGTWQNFTASWDIQIPATTSEGIGITYRTTNWVNNDNCGAWQVDVASNSIKLGYGTNSGTTGSYTNVSTVTVSLAAGSWHTLTLIINGTSHQVLVDGVSAINITNSTYNIAGYIAAHAFNGSGSTKNYYFNNFGVVASLSGTYQSPSLALSSVGTVGASMISVQSETLPSGTSYTIQTSLDGGATWQSATNGGAISGLSSGVSASGKSLLVKLTLTTANASFTPMIDAYTVYVSSSFSCVGTRSTAPIGYDTFMRANQSGWGTSTDQQTYTEQGSATLAISSNTGTVSGQAHVQLGNRTGTDESVLVQFSVGNVASQAGAEARYTNSSGTITAYRVFAQSGNFTLDKRVSGTLTTLQVVPFVLTTSTNYTIRLVCQGAAIQARIWQSNLNEPSTWQISQIDSSIASGGVAVSANVATGDTATFTKFIATLYPDPALSLASAGRAANSLVNWNAILPTNTALTVQTSVDNGVTWSTISAAGGAIPGLTLQPAPTVDDYSVDSHTSYTTTNGTGGSGATWTWDTANKRLQAVGGSKSVALYNGVTVTDVDMFADVYQAQSGGLVWRWSDASNYYELIVSDSATSSPNTMKINKVVAGSLTALGSSTGTFTFPAQTHHYVRVTMLGSVITAYFDGVSILTVTDASLSSGSVGVRNDTGTSYYYYLYIQPQGQDVSSIAPDANRLATKLTLTTTDPTVTPQVTDLQVMVGGPTFWPGTLIPTATYNSANSFVSSNAEDLKNQSNYLWSVADVVDSNSNYDVSFQPRTATPAPWPLDENNYQMIAGQQIHDILLAGIGEVYGADLYRNRMVIKNAIATSSYDQIFVGDGKATSWTLSNPIVAAPTAWTLNGLPVSFGLQGVDTGKQFYYQIGSTSITADSSQTVLTITDSLEIKYSGSSVVDVTRDNLSIPGTITQSALAAITGDSGIVTASVDVSSQNMSVAAAQTYGDQLLARYGVIGVTFNFTTLRSGLREGQQLMLYTPHFNLNKVLTLVTDVRLSQRVAPGVNGGSLWAWQVTAQTGPALGSWVKLLNLGLGN